MSEIFENVLVGVVWVSLILSVVCYHKERKAPRTKSLLWGMAVGAVGATLSFAALTVFYASDDVWLRLFYMFATLLWAINAAIDVEKLVRQLTMTPSMYGAAPSDEEAKEQFDKDAVEAWKLLREEYPS